MPVKLRTARKQVMAKLRNDAALEVRLAAQNILFEATATVPQIGNAPWATDALKSAGYVKSPQRNDYVAAMATAETSRNAWIAAHPEEGRIKPLQPDEKLPDVVAVPSELLLNNYALAIVNYPLSYALAVHDGLALFLSPRPWLFRAMQGEAPDFLNQCKAIVRDLSNVHLPTQQQLWANQVRVGQGQTVRQQLYQEFRATLPASELTRQGSSTRGHRETYAERSSRINDLFKAWLELRSSGGGYGGA